MTGALGPPEPDPDLRASADAVRRDLGSVMQSAAFKGSQRSQKFLRHVVECVLEGQQDRLKERTLGVDLFGRDAAYDTSDDAIVRVTANDVRKRLLAYDAEGSAGAEYRFDLPAGTYVPIVHRRAAPPAEPRPPGRADAVRRPPALWVALPIGLGLVVLGVATGWWGRGRYPGTAPSRYDVYQEILGPIAADARMPTEIVLSNPRVLLYMGSRTAEAPRKDPAASVPVPAALEPWLNPAAANDEQSAYPFHRLDVTADDYTGMGEAETAFELAHLFSTLGRPVSLTQSRFLNWESARAEHLVLLGAPHMSVWTRQSLDEADFVMEHDAIRDTHPRPGDPDLYRHGGQGTVEEDYGLIWMGRSPSGSRLLLLAGLGSTGTAGVGQFFCDPDRMRPVLARLKQVSKSRSVPADWQVLLRIRAKDHVPVDTSFVALRVHETAP